MKLIFSPDFQTILKHKILCKSVQWDPSCSKRKVEQTWRS